MSKLDKLKKKRGSNLKDLQKKLNDANNSGAPRDERIWKPTLNQQKKKGTAIVRLLPNPEGDAFVEVKSYSFNGPGGNFFDKALQTIGKDDPVQIAAINAFRKAKAEENDSLREQAKKWLPRSQYYANVYVVKDEENPENEGKVKIFQFGRQIFKLIEDAIKPEFDDVEAIDPFDLWEGAELRIRMVGKEIPRWDGDGKVLVPNYENSSFDSPSEFLDGDDDALNEVIEQCHDVGEFVDPEKFKSFDEVAARFEKVTGKPYDWLTTKGVNRAIEEEQEDEPESAPAPEPKSEEPKSEPADSGDEGEDEDPLEKFKRMAGKK